MHWVKSIQQCRILGYSLSSQNNFQSETLSQKRGSKIEVIFFQLQYDNNLIKLKVTRSVNSATRQRVCLGVQFQRFQANHPFLR